MSTPEQTLTDLRFIVAARQSRKLKAGENFEFPIEAQDARAKAWGEAQGGVHVGTAADFRSGTVPPWERKHTREWVNETGDKIRDYDAVIVTKMDRLSRGTDEDFSLIEAWAVRNQKKLVIVGEGGGVWYPARNDSDFWQWTAEKRRSRQEWEAIRERSMNRQADLRALGKLSGGAIPFGYDVYGDKFAKTLKPNDIGREYVPQIFRRVARGESLLKVAQWLDSQGVKPRYGEKWSAVSVSQIIRNHTYVGQRKADAYLNGKRRRGQGMIRLEVEAIVEAGIFLAANSRLKNAKRGGRRGPKNWEPALLTGVLRCGNCGAPMYRLKVRGGYVYYRCHGHLPQPKGCGTLVTASLLDSEVDKIMRTNEIWVHEWTFEAGEESQIRAAIDNIRLKLGDLPTQGLSDDDEDAERAKLRAQRNQLESQIDSATPDHWAKSVVTKKDGTPLTEAERWRDADQDGRREILKDYRITFKWDQLDGTREPAITVVPLWAETGKDDQS